MYNAQNEHKFFILYIAIQGFINLENCANSAADSLNNFLSGLLFILILVLVRYTEIKYSANAIRSKLGASVLLYYLTGFLIVSIIVGISDIAHSFHTVSQVYGQLEHGQVNCSSSAYYSLFVSVVIIFNYIFVEIGLVILLCVWFILNFCSLDRTSTTRSCFFA